MKREGQAPQPAAALSRKARGSGQAIDSRAVVNVSTAIEKRSASASRMLSTRISGAEAPALTASEPTSASAPQSMSPAPATNCARRPSRSATSRRRCELEEFGHRGQTPRSIAATLGKAGSRSQGALPTALRPSSPKPLASRPDSD
jgi:hypothetical protein